MPPALKFYFAMNPNFGKAIPEVELPTREEWAELLGYEPTKVNPNYDSFCKNYVERKTQELVSNSRCKLELRKISILSEDDDIIQKTEESDGFVRWF